MYSFIYSSFKLFEIGERTHENVRGARLHLKVISIFASRPREAENAYSSRAPDSTSCEKAT